MPESLQGRGFKDNEGETMPFLGGHFIPPPPPGAPSWIMAGPSPSQDHCRSLSGQTRRLRSVHRPAMRRRRLQHRPTHPSRGMPKLLQGPARHADGRTWASAARIPARKARGRRREMASGLEPRPWVPRGFGRQLVALTFSTKSVR